MPTFSFPPKKPLAITLLAVVVLLLAAFPSYYFFMQYQKSQKLLANPTAAAQEEVRALKARIGMLIELPAEEPTVATISDKEKLKDQPFFVKAENGDKVLIFTQARKAILYRPSINKIIEVSVINLGVPPADATSAASVAAPQSIKVAIYNGTNTTALTAKAEKQLKAKFPDLDVTTRENAKKRDYDKTMVVVLVQSKSPDATTIADTLGGVVSPFPQGETKPQADILIILGSDYLKK